MGDNSIKKRILCCDDEVALCDLLAEELQDEGYDVEKAYSGSQALKKIKDSNFDVILSDIRMPDGDGISVLRAVRAKNKTIPAVVLMTGYSDLSPAIAYQEGADAILSKPIDYQTLISTLKRVLIPAEQRFARKHVRVEIKNSEATITFDSQKSVDARMVNIGRGGFYIKTNQKIPAIGKTVNFSIPLENSPQSVIEGSAICRWVSEPSEDDHMNAVGFEFVELSSESVTKLSQYLLKHPTISYIPSNLILRP